jgi:membrane protein DedA with SNARE-associated domain
MDFITGLSSFIISVIDTAGYGGIFFLMVLEGSFIPIPSEIILPFSGFLASEGRFSLWGIALAGALGNIIGTLVTYAVARYAGLPFLYKYGKYVLVTKEDIDLAERLFKRYGIAIIFVTRLIPGIRGFLPIPAGVAKMKISPFITFVFIGSFVWSLFLTYVGYIIGEHWEVFSEYAHEAGTILVAIMVAGIGWWVSLKIGHIRRQKRKNKNI